MNQDDWTLEELLPTFAYYLRVPYGRLHWRNPEVRDLARRLGRTPGAVARKLTNIAACDPQLRATGRVGSPHRAKLEEELFERYLAERDAVIAEASAAYDRLMETEGVEPPIDSLILPRDVPSEALRQVRVRRNQWLFRQAVLSSYVDGCAMCDVDRPEFIIAAHIIPWAECPERRLDPKNGIALCPMHDRAFELGVMSVSKDFTILVRPGEPARSRDRSEVLTTMIDRMAGRPLRMPERFAPDADALEWHRLNRYYRT